MDEKSTPTPEKPERGEQVTTESDTNEEYDLPVELFAGIVILIMGALVLITPLFTSMPTNLVWNALTINIFSGVIYIIVGAIFIYRSGYL